MRTLVQPPNCTVIIAPGQKSFRAKARGLKEKRKVMETYAGKYCERCFLGVGTGIEHLPVLDESMGRKRVEIWDDQGVAALAPALA